MKKAILFTTAIAIVWSVFSGIVLGHIFGAHGGSLIGFIGGVFVGIVSMTYGLDKWAERRQIDDKRM